MTTTTTVAWRQGLDTKEHVRGSALNSNSPLHDFPIEFLVVVLTYEAVSIYLLNEQINE